MNRRENYLRGIFLVRSHERIRLEPLLGLYFLFYPIVGMQFTIDAGNSALTKSKSHNELY